MRMFGLAIALFGAVVAFASSADAPKLILDGKIHDVGTLQFEVGYRNQNAFLAKGTATVNGVVYRLTIDDSKKESPFVLHAKVIDTRVEGGKVVGWAVISIEKHREIGGYFALGKDQYYIQPMKKPAESPTVMPNPDIRQLQGRWRVVRVSTPAVFSEGDKDVRLEYQFEGNTYRVFRNGVLSYIADFKLGAAKGVKTIDERGAAPWSSSIGPMRLGVYSISGDDLVVAYTFGDPSMRPADLNEGRTRTIGYLKRVK
ncbi:MAG: hypothetical protein FJ303_26450 [Planctomycetes bacterium]|nr:hypothetical protein [Planctomycetota bacterium]